MKNSYHYFETKESAENFVYLIMNRYEILQYGIDKNRIKDKYFVKLGRKYME